MVAFSSILGPSPVVCLCSLPVVGGKDFSRLRLVLATEADRFCGGFMGPGFLSELLPALEVVGLIMRDRKSPPEAVGTAVTDPTLVLFGFRMAAEV